MKKNGQGGQRRASAVPTFTSALRKVGTLRFAHPALLLDHDPAFGPLLPVNVVSWRGED